MYSPIAVISAGSGTSYPSAFYLETDDGTRGTNWGVYTTIAGYTGTGHLNSDAANSVSGDITDPDDIISWTFNCSAGTYKVWIREATGVTTGAEDSVFVKMDSDSWIRYNDMAISINAWLWDEVHDSDNANAVVDFSLSQGSHTLRIAIRELNVDIDRVYITKNGDTPT
jgi:hypothetical protein